MKSRNNLLLFVTLLACVYSKTIFSQITNVDNNSKVFGEAPIYIIQFVPYKIDCNSMKGKTSFIKTINKNKDSLIINKEGVFVLTYSEGPFIVQSFNVKKRDTILVNQKMYYAIKYPTPMAYLVGRTYLDSTIKLEQLKSAGGVVLKNPMIDYQINFCSTFVSAKLVINNIESFDLTSINSLEQNVFNFPNNILERFKTIKKQDNIKLTNILVKLPNNANIYITPINLLVE
jgi:hypothetical protein